MIKLSVFVTKLAPQPSNEYYNFLASVEAKYP